MDKAAPHLDMNQVSAYLMDNYYHSGYCPEHLIPTNEVLLAALMHHEDKILVIYDGFNICGAAVYLTLPDETYNALESFDMRSIDDVAFLLAEKGPNLHFIIVAAKGYRLIREGVSRAKRMQIKSISWWNPTMTKLHRYNLN